VPSRHYHHPDAERPLAGARISLTDTFDARGARTTLSSRAWAGLYPRAAGASAAYVRQLLGLGAVVVGKTRAAQLAAGPPAWVDFPPPANPRGDGYQDAGASSAGAAASLAGYAWLDGAVGGACEFSSPLCVCVCVCVCSAILRHACG
jgi:Asp-tRNA(Asn)/Glu-tRNA(Gln) amidotransferase A subunit family amidase